MLTIRNLSKSYGNVAALRDVSLQIPPGMFGLLGPNGAGKSSLCLCRSSATRTPVTHVLGLYSTAG